MMQLGEARGPLSAALSEYLAGGPCRLDPMPAYGDPLDDDDFQLALFLAHELSYGGIEGVADELEWDPAVVRFRVALQRAMLERLAEVAGPPAFCEPAQVPERILALIDADDGPQLARYLETGATVEQFREFVIQRSAYQLKEADPHTFAIPRIDGPAKAAMVEIQADEYGGGDFRRMHSQLFAETMKALDLDSSFGSYVHSLPASTLATVNLISVFSMHRRWRGALVGHLTGFEITSPQPNRRYANGLRRLGFGERATEFYDEHVEADSVHENIAIYDLAGELAAQEPRLAGEIVFGVRALLFCEARFASHLLGAWEREETSLLELAPRVPLEI